MAFSAFFYSFCGCGSRVYHISLLFRRIYTYADMAHEKKIVSKFSKSLNRYFFKMFFTHLRYIEKKKEDADR